MDDLDPQLALMAIKHGLPFVQSGANFEIYAANEAFEELLGYSSFELKRKGWDSISVKNDDFEADKAMTAELVSGNRQVMTVIKSYVSKLGVPIPGQLTAIRFPQGTAPMECSLCFFVPLANGSKAALSLVTEYIEKHTNASHTMAEKIATMSQDLQLRKSMTVGERLWENFGQWALQNPKVATVVFLILLSLNPFPIIITWVTRMGWLPATPVQIEVQDGHGALRPATRTDLEQLGVIDDSKTANQIGFVALEKEYHLQTGNGSTFCIAEYSDGQFGSVSFATGRGERDSSSVGIPCRCNSILDGIDGSARSRFGSLQVGKSF
jgi:PAS domain S-box-containing protein